MKIGDADWRGDEDWRGRKQGGRRKEGGGGRTTVKKSNNPHLAGGGKDLDTQGEDLRTTCQESTPVDGISIVPSDS